MSNTVGFLSELTGLPTPVWAALSGAVSGLFAWYLGVLRIKASMERDRIKLIAETLSNETAERASFRATLMTEISAMRVQMKQCETDKEVLRDRIHATEGQILVLKASNEIMERWVAFFKQRSGPDPHQATTVRDTAVKK